MLYSTLMKVIRRINYTLGGDEWVPRFIEGIDRSKCTNCLACIKICPAGVFVRSAAAIVDARHRNRCYGCTACESNCEQGAISCKPVE